MFETRIKIEGDADLSPEIIHFLDEFTEQIPIQFNKAVDESVPAGRVYRRRAITARRTKRLQGLGFRDKGKSRSVVGYEFHRASAPGQMPARDTGQLTKDIVIVKKGKFERLIKFNAPHAGHVERQRPFIGEVIDRSLEVFNRL